MEPRRTRSGREIQPRNPRATTPQIPTTISPPPTPLPIPPIPRTPVLGPIRRAKQEKKGKEKQRGKGKNKELPEGAISISTLLSESDWARVDAMPIATRRLSTSKTRPDSASHSSSSRPNGVLTNGPADAHAYTHNQSVHTRDTSRTKGQPTSRSEEKDREKALERNIDNVVFGDVMFKAWYPSWYPKEIIGEKALDGKGMGIVVQTLYVCKKCFGYGKEVVDWVRHCRLCEKEVPGQKVYTHGGEGGEGLWSVWEVDGGVDTIFCQNLSLFAKLFLDNKSVFFDVSGFNYFLLVHTSPTTGSQQIIGFFSKEKMSWDNNNLACILIFPPWQRKGLGSILMGVSYEISRREGILGGPEKPISDLGKKGYKMFWGREIARWLLDVKETDRKKGRGMVSVDRISKETWIHGEDCLSVLRDMGVVEKAGRGKGQLERVRIDKEAVREWVRKMGLSLERVVDVDGFVEGYGYKAVADEEMGG